MNVLFYKVKSLLTIVLVSGLMSSCIYDYGEDEPEVNTEIDPVVGSDRILNISLAVPLADVAPTAPAPGYQEGDAYENYIDIQNNGYRIYFFGTDNKLIQELDPMGFFAVDSEKYRKYEILGRVPDKLVPEDVDQPASFKVMVLANWTQYPAVTPGETTIDALCNACESQFPHLTNFVLSPRDRDKRLIPLYGIRQFDNVKFEKGKRITLDDPITMLRAMAKVEVILDVDQDLSLKGVKLRGYNDVGYCAPNGVYSQTDYDHGGNWDADYVHRLHLVGGKNDVGATSKTLDFRCLNTKESDKKETWIAYIPEYRNVNDGDGSKASDEAIIDLIFNKKTDKTFNIYFADYSDSAEKVEEHKRMNIERNNIYRFTVKINNDKMEIFVRQWNYLEHPEIIL